MIVTQVRPAQNPNELRIELTRSGPHSDMITARIVSPDVTPMSHFFPFPMQRWEVEQALDTVASQARQTIKRNVPAESLDPIKDYGARLFNSLFQGALKLLYDRPLAKTQEHGTALRVCLVMDDPDLEWLPWELLYDSDRQDFVALSTRSPLVRQRSMPTALPDLWPVPGPSCRVLVVGADLKGSSGVADEIAWLRQLEKQFAPRLQLHEVLERATREQFLNALARGGFHVLHFIGTGLGSFADEREAYAPERQGLVLMPEGDSGRSSLGVDVGQIVRAPELLRALRSQKELRLVVLSAWHTLGVASQLADAVPAAIGMRQRVTPRACLAFVQGLYPPLLEGQGLEAAVTTGRTEIDRQNPGSREWCLPVCYLQTANSLLLSPPAAPGPGQVGHAASGTRKVKGSPEFDADPERKKIQIQIQIEEKNLQELTAKGARFGDLVPDFLRSRIEDARTKIEKLQASLKDF